MPSEDRYLVTGAGGFIVYLVEALLRRGHRVRAFVRYTSNANKGWLDDISSDLKGRLELFTATLPVVEQSWKPPRLLADLPHSGVDRHSRTRTSLPQTT